MSFDKILVLISHESRRGRLTARQFRVELNRLGLGGHYKKPNDINLFREYLRSRQFPFGESGKSALKLNIHGIQKQDTQDGPVLVAKILRTIVDNRINIGTVRMNLRTGELGYNVQNVKGDDVDYVELLQEVVDEYYTKRRIQYDEIDGVIEKMLGRIGFSDGPIWFVREDKDALESLDKLLQTLYEWGYNYRTFEIALQDIKKTSRLHKAIETKARDYVLAEVRRITGRGKRVFTHRYRGISFIIDALRTEGAIAVKAGSGEMTLVEDDG